MKLTGIDRLWFVRHAESTGNVARDLAEGSGAEVIDIAEPDAEVPLSDRGRAQAATLTNWVGGLPAAQRPTALVASPYRRAYDTAHAIASAYDLPLVSDERLRDRELGILDRLTRAGVAARFPDEHARKRHLGQFYYRPPGGESWADLTLRLRDVMRDLDREYDGARLMVLTHEVPILLMRYLLEGLSEAELLAVRRSAMMPNCSTTTWVADQRGTLALETFNEAVVTKPVGAPR